MTKPVPFREVVRRYKSGFKFRKELLEFFRFMFESPNLQRFVTCPNPSTVASSKREKPGKVYRRMIRFNVVNYPKGGCHITQFVDPDHDNAVTDYMVVINNGRCSCTAFITPGEFTDDTKQWSPKAGSLEHRKHQMWLLLNRISYGNAIAVRFLSYIITLITPICGLNDDQKKFIARVLQQLKGVDK